MTTDDLLENYVRDVVLRLPRKVRRDVGYELRALLEEELRGRAETSGREPDAQLAVQLLADFGRPADVADRYRPAGFTVIKPADAPQFARIALGGVVLQWVASLVATFAARPEGVEWLSLLGSWWVTWGLGAFWWPGLLVSLSIIAGAVAARREMRDSNAPRLAELDRDKVRRGFIVVYIALGLLGATIVLALPSLAVWGSALPAPLIGAFEFDAGFLAWRAPWVLAFWAVSLGLGIALLVSGRWSRTTRLIELLSAVGGLILLIAWLALGPIFVSPTTDSVTKLCLAALVILLFVDIVLSIRRMSIPLRAPAV
ncbi:hypothetical protein HDC94_001791 [Leifsonia sp. AK011]|uniref:hypothetical protein n=1 Tax=Leifsonia sp. AK011 TaxID=2723075 RepID=UPI0015C6C52D|nr:hypothetical protein [Leifsonia sp. AK011]NYF10635.1 hypothetical protein [Leifsonia sp. AK011]